MDGLNRKVASFSTLRIRRSQEKASYQDTMIPTGVADSTGRTISSPERVLIDAYVTSAKDVLKNWDRHAVGIVLLPALGDGTYESMHIYKNILHRTRLRYLNYTF